MSIAKLIEMQKKAQTNAKPEPKQDAPASAGSTDSAAEIASDVPEPEAAGTPTSSAQPKGLGLNVVGKAKPSAPASIQSAAVAAERVAEATARPAPAPIETGEFSLEDLAGLDASTIETEQRSVEGSGFDDEIEATAPDRDLPPDLTPDMLAFVESLDGVYGVLHDPDMFAQQVRLVMMELQENKEYKKLLSDPDVHVMIQGMRRTMGLARVRKQAKSSKVSTNKSARKKSGVSDSAMAMLDSLMGGSE